MRFTGLWRHKDFMCLWAGQTVSSLGSTITREALPYTAILTLNATPLQMGLLGAAGSAPLLLFGLLAGAWVDRLPRRPVMVVADLGRALLLLSIPLAYLIGWLGIVQLCAVAALVGILTVFFDTAYQAYLPALVEREQLVEGNSKLGLSGSLAEISGPPLGGVLVQLIGGPITVLLDAVSFLVSALSLGRIGAIEPAPSAPASHNGADGDTFTTLRASMFAGLLAIAADPLLRPLAISTAIRSFFGWFFGAIYGLYAIHTLGLSTMMVGLTVACGGLGAFLGSLLVRPLARRLGIGPAIVVGRLVEAGGFALLWLAGAAPVLALPLLVVAQIVGDLGDSAATINQLSLRQAVTPERLLGRVNAGMSVLGQGVGTLGMLTGGLLAGVIGLHATVAVAVLGILAGNLWLVFTPLRRVRELPGAEEGVC
jgi:MFS family permease